MSNPNARVYDAAVAVTPNDTEDDPAGPFAGLLVITAGSGLVFVDIQGNTTTITGALAVLSEIRVAVKRVKATGTGCAVAGYRTASYKPTAKS